MSADPRPSTASPFFVPGLVLGGTVLVVIVGALLGLPLALLAAAALILALVITLMWRSLSHLSEDAGLTLDEALSLAAPTAEEEQKRAVLRALKDLDYELRVGKVSEADYLELAARYREDAKRLILAVDETLAEKRAYAERLLEERRKKETQKRATEEVPTKKLRKKDRTDTEPPAPPSESSDGEENPS